MKKLLLVTVLTSTIFCLNAESWKSIVSPAGSSVVGFGKSIANGVVAMGKGMAGTTPSGYHYNFRVFNGANIPVSISVDRAKNIMGAQFNVGGGDSTTLQVGQDSGSTFGHESLSFSIKISGAGGLDYTDDHYTLGAKNDTSVYFYHTFNHKDSGVPCAELLGGGYTTTSDFSGRIENSSKSKVALTFVMTSLSSRAVHTMTIPDLDPGSFNYLKVPQGYLMRPSTLTFAPGGSVLVPTTGIGQITSKAGVTPVISNPVTYNYVVNDSLAYETGIGPGGFNQPKTGAQLRDISPFECQISYQSASLTAPVGTLFPYDIATESIWYVYTGYGWSESQGKIIQYPMGQIPTGKCATCLCIRPSIASVKTNGPARLLILRLSINEEASDTSRQSAQMFITRLLTGQVSIYGIANAPSNGVILRKSNEDSFVLKTGSSFLSSGIVYPVLTSFSFTDALVKYPPLSKTVWGASVMADNLTPSQKSAILGMDLPSTIGVLYDSVTKITARIMVSDIFYSYGMGSGPFYYSVTPPYLDVAQMLGSLISYIGLCNFAAFDQSVFTQIQKILPQTVMNWVSAYYGNPLAVQDSIATFLVLIGQGKISDVLENFGTSGSTPYAISNPVSLLSSQGHAFLKMLLYGPCSMSQVPIYYKGGGMSFQQVPGWPPVTVRL